MINEKSIDQAVDREKARCIQITGLLTRNNFLSVPKVELGPEKDV